MKKNKMNVYLSLGLLIVGSLMIVNHLIELPDPIYSFGLGLGIGLELIGVYSTKYDMTKIKKFKRDLIAKIVK